MVQHLVINNTNDHLQNAIAPRAPWQIKGLVAPKGDKYYPTSGNLYLIRGTRGILENFTFAVVEFCDLSVLLQLEQHYLDIIFSLPAYLRYNFSRFAEASFKGLTHSEETLARMSDSHTGKTHTEETRAKMSDSRTGKTPTPETRAKMSDYKSGALNPMFGKI